MLLVTMLMHIEVACCCSLWHSGASCIIITLHEEVEWGSREKMLVLRRGGRVHSTFCALHGAPHCIRGCTKRIGVHCNYSVSNASRSSSLKIWWTSQKLPNWPWRVMHDVLLTCSNGAGQSRLALRIFTELYGFAECGSFCGALTSCCPACTTAGGHKTSGCFSWRHSSSQASLDAKLPGHSSKTCEKSSKTLSALDATNVVQTSGVEML